MAEKRLPKLDRAVRVYERPRPVSVGLRKMAEPPVKAEKKADS